MGVSGARAICLGDRGYRGLYCCQGDRRQFPCERPLSGQAPPGGGGDEILADSSLPLTDAGSYGLYSTVRSCGQTFTGNGGKLSKVTFSLKRRTTVPVASVVARLYLAGPTYPNNPTGSAVATSTTVLDASTLTTSGVDKDFLFDKSYTLVSGTNYYIGLEKTSGNLAVNENVDMGGDWTVGAGHYGNLSNEFNSVWSNDDQFDLYFKLYTTPTAPPALLDSVGFGLVNDWNTYPVASINPFALQGTYQSVLIPATGKLYSIKFLLKAMGNVGIAQMAATVYAKTGAVNSETPTGSPLATSTAIPMSSITTDGSGAVYEFLFTGPNQITLNANDVMCIAVERASPGGDDTGQVCVGSMFDWTTGQAATPKPLRNTGFNQGFWGTDDRGDVCYEIYTT